MLPEDPWNSWWFKATAYSLLASVGGLIGYLMRKIDAQEKISWLQALLQTIGAGFVGLLILLTCMEFNFSLQWTGVIVGVFGWLGANVTIRVLERLVLKKLGIEKQPETENVKSSDV